MGHEGTCKFLNSAKEFQPIERIPTSTKIRCTNPTESNSYSGRNNKVTLLDSIFTWTLADSVYVNCSLYVVKYGKLGCLDPGIRVTVICLRKR